MCLMSPSTPQVEKYKESAQSTYPDNGTQISATARRTADRVRASTPTILTSGNGVLDAASTAVGKKTLLGA